MIIKKIVTIKDDNTLSCLIEKTACLDLAMHGFLQSMPVARYEGLSPDALRVLFTAHSYQNNNASSPILCETFFRTAFLKTILSDKRNRIFDALYRSDLYFSIFLKLVKNKQISITSVVDPSTGNTLLHFMTYDLCTKNNSVLLKRVFLRIFEADPALNINVKDHSNNTPLHYLIDVFFGENAYAETIALLLRNGADPNIRSHVHGSALEQLKQKQVSYPRYSETFQRTIELIDLKPSSVQGNELTELREVNRQLQQEVQSLRVELAEMKAAQKEQTQLMMSILTHLQNTVKKEMSEVTDNNDSHMKPQV